MDRQISGGLRLVVLVAVLLVAAVLVAPVQHLARRKGWRLGDVIPVHFCRTLCWLLKVRPHVRGTEAAGPRLLVPNHVSWLDIPALGCCGPVSFIAKREVGQWPILGGLARLQGAVFIDRSRRRSIPAANRIVAERLAEGGAVVLFAEGTTGDGNRTKRFFSSHFEAAKDALGLVAPPGRIVVQPVSIAYTRCNGLPLGRQERPRIAWYGDMTLLPHLWGMVTGGPIDCVIRFETPLDVEPAVSRKRLASRCETIVRAATAAALCGRVTREDQSTAAIQPVLIGAERS